MRLSLTGTFSLMGLWTEESNEPLKTSIQYDLLTYDQLIKLRNGILYPAQIAPSIRTIYNCIIRDMELGVVTSKKDILWFLENMESQFNLLMQEMVKDSVLSVEEYRKLEFIVYYLNWKADETSRRTSYNCDNCRKWKFLDTRYCYLENPLQDLPKLVIIEDEETGERKLDKSYDNQSEEISMDDMLKVLNELSSIHKDLSTFEIFRMYFDRMMEGSKMIELCPEAIKIKSENLAEMFEMEARCSEYHVFPFPGGQMQQPAILIEAFDAIRTGRNIFHSKKMEEVRGSSRSKAPKGKSSG